MTELSPFGLRLSSTYSPSQDSLPNARENAHLIAAAPALLAECKRQRESIAFIEVSLKRRDDDVRAEMAKVASQRAEIARLREALELSHGLAIQTVGYCESIAAGELGRVDVQAYLADRAAHIENVTLHARAALAGAAK